MSKKSTGLGKGLGALLPSTIEFSDKGMTFKSPEEPAISNGMIAMIDISKIERNKYQPRKDFENKSLEELKRSISTHGLITPITVKKSITGYEIISGERRWRAALAAGLSEIPAYIMEVNSDVNKMELALIENLQREDLNPIEVANGFAWLIEDGNLTQEEVAQRVGKDRASVANYLRLLKLPQPVQDNLRKKEITIGHAKALLSLVDHDRIIKAGKIVLDQILSVRATEELVKNIELGNIKISNKLEKQDVKFKKKQINLPPDIVALIEDDEKQLRYKYGTKVKINPKDEVSGTLELDYNSIDDYTRIVNILLNKSITDEDEDY